MSSIKVHEKPLNKALVDILDELKGMKDKKGEPFKSRAYLKAQQSIINCNKDIYSIDDIKNLPNIGKSIIEKLEEFINTGKIDSHEKEKNDPVTIALDAFSKIYGVGPKKAMDLIDKKIFTIEQLSLPENTALLNDKQKIGLKNQEQEQEQDQYQKNKHKKRKEGLKKVKK